jgi:hypothetical protein
MSQTAANPKIPADVRAFAARYQIESLLPAALEAARRHFPKAEVSLALEPSYEPDDRGAILVRVRKADMTAEEARAAYDAYTREMHALTPRPDPCVLSLELDLSR